MDFPAHAFNRKPFCRKRSIIRGSAVHVSTRLEAHSAHSKGAWRLPPLPPELPAWLAQWLRATLEQVLSESPDDADRATQPATA